MTDKELEKIYNEACKAVYWTTMSLLKNSKTVMLEVFSHNCSNNKRALRAPFSFAIGAISFVLRQSLIFELLIL